MKNQLFRWCRLAPAIFISGAFTVNVAFAANGLDTWTGGSTPTNWNVAGNWTGANTPPIAGDTLAFGGTTGLINTNNLAANTAFNGILFNPGAGAFSLFGNAIALNNTAGIGGIVGLTNSSSNPQVINLALTLNTNITVDAGSAGITNGGAISGTGAITNAGSGTLTLNVVNSWTGGLTINNGTVLSKAGGSGSGNKNGAIPRNGPVTINAAGTLMAGVGDAFGYGTDASNITLNAGTVTTTPGAFNVTLPNLVFIGGTLTSDPGNTGASSHNYTFNGNNSTMTVNSLAASATATINAGVGIGLQRDTTFNIASGSAPGGVDMLVASAMNGSHKLIKIGAGRLNLSGANTYSGSTTISNGVLGLVGSGSLTSSPIAVTNGATFDVSQLTGTYTLAATRTLGGNGVITGNVTAANSSIIDAGFYGGKLLGFSNDLTLQGVTAKFVLSGTTNGANSKINVAGNLDFGGAVNTVSISGFASLQSGTYPLMTYNTESSLGSWTLIGFAATGRQTANINDTGAGGAGEIDLLISGNAANLIWVGDGVTNDWDTTSTNWFNTSITNVDRYFDNDLVTFDDSSTNTTVNISTTLLPSVITVSNNIRSYTFTNASGLISGSAKLIKEGTNMLLLQEAGGDNFSGGITVSNGTLILDNEFSAITGGLLINTGATVQVGTNEPLNFNLPSGTLTDNGTLLFNEGAAVAMSAVIGGSGGVSQMGSGTLTLSGINTFSGNIVVSNGTTLIDNRLAANDGSNAGLGSSPAPGRTITIGANATLNGTVQNWFGSALPDANFPSLIVNGGTVTSSHYTAIGSVTLSNGATLTSSGSPESQPNLYQAFQLRGTITVSGSSASTISSSVGKDNHLSTNTIFNVAVTSGSGPDLTVSTGLRNQSGDYSTAVGALTKTGAGTMLLTASNGYTGNTTISAGTLALSGAGSISNSPVIAIGGGATFDVSALSPSFVLMPNQTLSNSTSTAVINGNADVSGGTDWLTYGTGTPSLTITNGTLTLAAGTVFKVNNTGAPLLSSTNKIIARAAGGSVAGTVPAAVTVTGNGLAPGATASLQINGGELYLAVVGGSPGRPRITNFSINGPALTIQATNGAASGQFKLLESTNVAIPLTNWVSILTNVFDGSGNLNLSTNIVHTNDAQEFYLLLE